MERKYSLSDISFLNLVALAEIQGFGPEDCMYFVKEEGIGVDGLLLLDSDDAVETMIEHCTEHCVNIIVAKGNEDRHVQVNVCSIICEEQIPIGSPGGFVLSLSQDGVIHSIESNVNIQQSCNVNTENFIDEDCGEEEVSEDEDKSSSDFELDRGDFRGKNISFKAWQR